MIAKTPTGVDFFDEAYGGAYAGRSMLATGRADTGKSVLALQFLAKGLKLNERCLLLSVRPAEDVILYAATYGINLEEAVADNELFILEYSDYVPGRDREDQLKLPPESFLQLKQIIEEQAIQRVALDTVLPWVAIPEPENLAEHVFSFVRVFNRLGTTALFTLPKPASTAAFRLRKLLEDLVPVSVSLVQNEANHDLTWNVNKYLGAETMKREIPYEAKPKYGIVRKTSTERSGSTPSSGDRASFVPDEPPASPPESKKEAKPSFSDFIPLSAGSPTNSVGADHGSPARDWSHIQPAHAP